VRVRDYRHSLVSMDTRRTRRAFASSATGGCIRDCKRRRSTIAAHSMADPLAIAWYRERSPSVGFPAAQGALIDVESFKIQHAGSIGSSTALVVDSRTRTRTNTTDHWS
jgi:hypothetical protein